MDGDVEIKIQVYNSNESNPLFFLKTREKVIKKNIHIILLVKKN